MLVATELGSGIISLVRDSTITKNTHSIPPTPLPVTDELKSTIKLLFLSSFQSSIVSWQVAMVSSYYLFVVHFFFGGGGGRQDVQCEFSEIQYK